MLSKKKHFKKAEEVTSGLSSSTMSSSNNSQENSPLKSKINVQDTLLNSIDNISYNIFLLFLFIFSVIFSTLMGLSSLLNKVKFCQGNDKDSWVHGCKYCPKNAKCENYDFKCDPGYEKVGDFCIEKDYNFETSKIAAQNLDKLYEVIENLESEGKIYRFDVEEELKRLYNFDNRVIDEMFHLSETYVYVDASGKITYAKEKRPSLSYPMMSSFLVSFLVLTVLYYISAN